MNLKLTLGLHFFFVIALCANTVKYRYKCLCCRFGIISSNYCAPGILSANRAFHSSALPSTEYSQAVMRIIYRYIHYILFSHADNVKLNHKFQPTFFFALDARFDVIISPWIAPMIMPRCIKFKSQRITVSRSSLTSAIAAAGYGLTSPNYTEPGKVRPRK